MESFAEEKKSIPDKIVVLAFTVETGSDISFSGDAYGKEGI